jgi:YD repeat-containing protein
MSNIEPIYEYDTNGNMIHYKNSNGYEVWYERDTNGNPIHYRDSNGVEGWYERDTNGNPIHYRDSNGVEGWYEYDTNGKCIHYRNSFGLECWYEYDSKGNQIHYRNSEGVEYWYDSDGNRIDKPTEKKDNDTMSNNKPTQFYVIQFQDGSFYAKYEDERETSNLLAADTFTLKEAIEKVKSLNHECKIREYIPATLGQEINPKQNILDALYLSSAEASKLKDPVLCGRIKEVIEMVKEYM